jgi:hypothetical protein
MLKELCHNFAATLAVTLLAFCGCAATQPPIPPPGQLERDHLDFIRDGATSREQVLLRLGIPSAQFEGARIMTYRLFFNGTDLLPLPVEVSTEDPRYRTWSQPTYNLVLVFDGRNFIERHSFIKVR